MHINFKTENLLGQPEPPSLEYVGLFPANWAPRGGGMGLRITARDGNSMSRRKWMERRRGMFGRVEALKVLSWSLEGEEDTAWVVMSECDRMRWYTDRSRSSHTSRPIDPPAASWEILCEGPKWTYNNQWGEAEDLSTEKWCHTTKTLIGHHLVHDWSANWKNLMDNRYA